MYLVSQSFDSDLHVCTNREWLKGRRESPPTRPCSTWAFDPLGLARSSRPRSHRDKCIGIGIAGPDWCICHRSGRDSRCTHFYPCILCYPAKESFPPRNYDKKHWGISIVSKINETVIMILTCSRTRSRDRYTRRDPDRWHWRTVYSTDNSFPGFAPSLLDPIESRSWRAVAEDVFLLILCRPNNLRFLLKFI